MSFVDDDKIVGQLREWLATTGISVRSTQRFEGYGVSISPSRRQRRLPHRNERSRRNHQSSREPASDGDRDVRLTHTDFVAKQSAVEAIDRFVQTLHGTRLVSVQRDGAKRRPRRLITKNERSDARLNFGDRGNRPRRAIA